MTKALRPMKPTAPRLYDVDVPGGTLRVARWGEDGVPTAVGAHGITSSHVFWQTIGEELAGQGLGLIAPDLAGRGDSFDPGEGSSIARHGDDLLRIADDAGLDTVVVAGHSMGGFVAAVAAVRHADRVDHVVLVDGGPPLGDRLPADVDVEAVLQQVIGPSLDRLDRRFEDRKAYRAFWHAHPSTGPIPDPLVDDYADYDLIAAEDGWRSKVSRTAILADARDLLLSEDVREAVPAITCTTDFLYAERGMLDGPEGLYPAGRIDELFGGLPLIRPRLVEDTNHFTIGMGGDGASVVAAVIAAALD